MDVNKTIIYSSTFNVVDQEVMYMVARVHTDGSIEFEKSISDYYLYETYQENVDEYYVNFEKYVFNEVKKYGFN